MSKRRRMFFKAAHRDRAERPIIQALRSVGASVYAVSGKDIPDLLVGFGGVTYLFEVKSRILSEEKGRKARVRETAISPGQKEFSETWRGGPARFIYEPAEALRAIGAPYHQTPQTGLRWLAVNGAHLCESCWLPENGLHAKDCPTRKALAKPPKVQSAYRAAKTLEDELPKTIEVHRTVEMGMAGHPPDVVRHSVESISRPEAVRRGLVTTEQVKAALE